MHLTKDQLVGIFFKYHKDKVDFIRRARMLSRSLHNKKNRLKSFQNAEKMLVALDSSPKVLGSLLLRNGMQQLGKNETSGLSNILKTANPHQPQQKRRSIADDWDLEDGSTVRLNPSSNKESSTQKDNEWQLSDQVQEPKPKKLLLAAFENTDDTEFSDIKQELRFSKKTTTVEFSKDGYQIQAENKIHNIDLKLDSSPRSSNQVQAYQGGLGGIKTPLNVITPIDREKESEKTTTQKTALQKLDLQINTQLTRSLSKKPTDSGGRSKKSLLSSFKSNALSFWNKVKEVSAIPEKYRRFEYRKDLMKKNNLDEQAFVMKKNRQTYYQEMAEKFEKDSNKSTSSAMNNWQKLRDFCISSDNRAKEIESAKRPGFSQQNSQLKQITTKQKKILALAFIQNILEQSSEESLNEEEAANVSLANAEKNGRVRHGEHLRERHTRFFGLQTELRRTEQPRPERQQRHGARGSDQHRRVPAVRSRSRPPIAGSHNSHRKSSSRFVSSCVD